MITLSSENWVNSTDINKYKYHLGYSKAKIWLSFNDEDIFYILKYIKLRNPRHFYLFLNESYKKNIYDAIHILNVLEYLQQEYTTWTQKRKHLL